jgi:hypothetical protein
MAVRSTRDFRTATIQKVYAPKASFVGIFVVGTDPVLWTCVGASGTFEFDRYDLLLVSFVGFSNAL